MRGQRRGGNLKLLHRGNGSLCGFGGIIGMRVHVRAPLVHLAICANSGGWRGSDNGARTATMHYRRRFQR